MAIINCYDINGDAIRFLTQWDHDISIRATGVKTSPVPEFRFSNKQSQKSKCISGVVVGDGVKATIPNGFLQEALPIYVQLFYTYPSGDAKTEHTFVIPVKPASMPDGAVYEPVEVRSIVELEKRVKALEENGVPGAGGIPSNPSFDTVSLGGDAGVVIKPEGTADSPAIKFYGAHGDEPVMLNNVADATDDRSAPNLGQVKQLVEEHSEQNADQAVYMLTLSEDETAAQANSNAITAAIAEHKNVVLKFGRYPVMPGIVVESGTLNLNGSELYSVQYKYSGGLVILSGENPVIYGGALAGTYDLADNEDGYVFHESEKLIVPEGVNDAIIRDMELHNCWGYAISGTDGIVERVYVDTAPSTTQNNFYCVTDKIPIPDNCKYVTAAGGSGYNYIISYRDVIYDFVDVDGKNLGRRTGVPRVRIPIPDGAASVTIRTFTLTHEVIPYYAYFTNYTETLTVEDCVIRHCHSLAMANMCGPTTVSRCRFIGMGKPRPGAAGTTRGTTGGIDIEDIQTPELIMSDCHSEDCMNLLLFGGYNATVSNCTGAVIRSYRGWRLQLDNCNTSYLDIAGSCPVHTSNTYAEILKIEESAYRYVSGDIATSRMYKALGAFDHYFIDRKDATASSDGYPTVPLHGTALDRTYRAAPGGIFAKGSKVSLLCYPHDNQKAYYGAGGVGGDSYGITANAPMYTNGYTISDSTFDIADSRGIYSLTTKSLSGAFKNCVFNLIGGNYFNKFLDGQDAPCHLVFEDCVINNADYHLFNVVLYDGSVLEFRNCTIADPDRIVKSGADKITIKITDGENTDNSVREVNTPVAVSVDPVTLDGTAPEQTVNLAWTVDNARTIPAFANYLIPKASISYPRAFSATTYTQFFPSNTHGNTGAFVAGHSYFLAMCYRMDGDSKAVMQSWGTIITPTGSTTLSGSGWAYGLAAPTSATAANFILTNGGSGTGTIDYVYCIDITAMKEAGTIPADITMGELVEMFGELPLVPGEDYPGGTIGDGTATLSINRDGEISTVDNTSSTATVKGGDILSVEGGSVAFMLKILKTVAAGDSGIWEGIKWVAFGDSLTDGSINANTKYHKLIAERTGITVVDMGKGGTGYWRTNESGNAFYQRMANVPADADIITIFGSVNDWRTRNDGVEIGTATDTIEDGTLAGYINECIDVANEKAPYAQIALVTPLDYHGIPDDTMEAIANIIVAVARARKIKCVDMYHDSGFRVDDPTFATVYCTDYSATADTYGHPSNLAHEKIIAPEFMQILRRMIL